MKTDNTDGKMRADKQYIQIKLLKSIWHVSMCVKGHVSKYINLFFTVNQMLSLFWLHLVKYNV